MWRQRIWSAERTWFYIKCRHVWLPTTWQFCPIQQEDITRHSASEHVWRGQEHPLSTHTLHQKWSTILRFVNKSDFLPLVLSAPGSCSAFTHLDQICRLAVVWRHPLPHLQDLGVQLMRCTYGWTEWYETLNTALLLLCAGGCKYCYAPS